MRTQCVIYPKSERMVVIHASQLTLCDNNHCAAALLSFFGHGHDYKLAQQEQALHLNTIAHNHGEEGTQDTSLLQFHSEEGLEQGLLGLYGRSMIRKAVALLLKKEYLSLHRNPNKRYRFDKTHYFLFHPDQVIHDLGAIPHDVKITDRSVKNNGCTESRTEVLLEQESLVNHDDVKITDRSVKNTSPCVTNNATRSYLTTDLTEEKKDLPSSVPPQTHTPPTLAVEAQEILGYLNTVHGRHYRETRQIVVLLKSGRTVEECRLVIEWLWHVERIRNKEGYDKYCDNVTPFRPLNFDRNLEKARLALKGHSEKRRLIL